MSYREAREVARDIRDNILNQNGGRGWFEGLPLEVQYQILEEWGQIIEKALEDAQDEGHNQGYRAALEDAKELT